MVDGRSERSNLTNETMLVYLKGEMESKENPQGPCVNGAST